MSVRFGATAELLSECLFSQTGKSDFGCERVQCWCDFQLGAMWRQPENRISHRYCSVTTLGEKNGPSILDLRLRGQLSGPPLPLPPGTRMWE